MHAPARAVFGFVAGALSVLIFHQGMWAALHVAGLMPPPYPMGPSGPWGVPHLMDMAFWGGVWGILFGLALPAFPRIPSWLLGFGLGALAILAGWFLVAPLKGHPIGNGWHPIGIALSILINGFWGLGVGLIAPLLIPRSRRSARKFA
jgi:hypothetical protein